MASDPDGAPPLIYGAIGLPPGLYIDASTGVVTGTVAASSAGPYPVLVTAADANNTAVESFTWTVYHGIYRVHETGNPDAHISKIWYEVTENDTGEWRDATLRFADQHYTIYQAPYAAPCPVVVSPTSVTSIGAEGGSATITVTSECEWQAITHDGFITITGGTFGVDNGQVTISLGANPNSGDRVGELFIGVSRLRAFA